MLSEDLKVLIIGYRQGLIRALERRNIPFAIWSERPIINRNKSIMTIVHNIEDNRERAHEVAEKFQSCGSFTHVIAGTESGVYSASLVRRLFNARLSKFASVIACHDKVIMKERLASLGIPMSKFVPGRDYTDSQDLIDLLGLPIVVKHRRASGGKDTVFVSDKAELDKVMDRKKLAESFIHASEGSIESFIHDGKILFTNLTQYLKVGEINILPAIYPNEISEAIKKLNEAVISGLEISWGMTHLEFYLTPDGPLFGEIALRPPGGYIMNLIDLAYGFNPWDAFLSIELGEGFTFSNLIPKIKTASIILHPGEGTVADVDPFLRASKLPIVKKAKVKVLAGDKIRRRNSIGIDTGYLLLATDSESELLCEIANITRHPLIHLHDNKFNKP